MANNKKARNRITLVLDDEAIQDIDDLMVALRRKKLVMSKTRLAMSALLAGLGQFKEEFKDVLPEKREIRSGDVGSESGSA